MRRRRAVVPIDAKVIRAERIDRDQDDVGTGVAERKIARSVATGGRDRRSQRDQRADTQDSSAAALTLQVTNYRLRSR